MMKTKRTVLVMLLVMLSACLLCGLAACSGKSKATEPTVVGRWVSDYKGDPWEISFTEDGDYYDSLGKSMTVYIETSYYHAKNGSWRIRADGKIWLTAVVSRGSHSQEYEWSGSYELDGDTLKFAGATFTRAK